MYRYIIVSVVLYGRAARSLTLREEHRHRVFEKKVLKRISGLNRGEVTGKRRMLHNEEFHNLYSSPNIRFSRADKEEWDVPHI